QELASDTAIDSNPAWRAPVDATRDVPVATSAALAWADAIIFSTATRFGAMASHMTQFLDTQGGHWATGGFVNRVASAMASANNLHGAQEASSLSLYTSLMHWGAIIVPPGYTDEQLFATGGNPYGTSVTLDEEGNMQTDVKPAVEIQTKRTIDIAA